MTLFRFHRLRDRKVRLHAQVRGAVIAAGALTSMPVSRSTTRRSRATSYRSAAQKASTCRRPRSTTRSRIRRPAGSSPNARPRPCRPTSRARRLPPLAQKAGFAAGIDDWTTKLWRARAKCWLRVDRRSRGRHDLVTMQDIAPAHQGEEARDDRATTPGMLDDDPGLSSPASAVPPAGRRGRTEPPSRRWRRASQRERHRAGAYQRLGCAIPVIGHVRNGVAAGSGPVLPQRCPPCVDPTIRR